MSCFVVSEFGFCVYGANEVVVCRPHTLGAEELYKAHLTPYLQEAQATLKGKLDETHAQNSELAQTVQAQRREIEKLLAQLESAIPVLRSLPRPLIFPPVYEL